MALVFVNKIPSISNAVLFIKQFQFQDLKFETV